MGKQMHNTKNHNIDGHFKHLVNKNTRYCWLLPPEEMISVGRRVSDRITVDGTLYCN